MTTNAMLHGLRWFDVEINAGFVGATGRLTPRGKRQARAWQDDAATFKSIPVLLPTQVAEEGLQ
jgi:hypothetical protein